jgi:hypothetical protein
LVQRLGRTVWRQRISTIAHEFCYETRASNEQQQQQQEEEGKDGEEEERRWKKNTQSPEALKT